MNDTANTAVDEIGHPPVLLLDDENDREILTQSGYFEPDELFAGNVLTVEDDDGKHHYVVREVEEREDDRVMHVHITPAKSSLPKVALLLGTLAVMWFVIDWAVTKLF